MFRNSNHSLELLMQETCRVISESGIVVYPTETLYALGATARKTNAVKKVVELKERPADRPLSVAVASVSDIEKYAVMTPLSWRLADKFLPGPLTLVLESRGNLPGITGNKLGIRVPNHPAALYLACVCGPITATSANLCDGPAPMKMDDAKKQLGDGVDIYLDSGMCKVAKGSTVVDLFGNRFQILREGAIPRTKLEKCLDAN